MRDAMAIGLATLLLMGLHAGVAFSEEPRGLPGQAPEDDPLVRKVEQRVEMLRKWKILEAIDPSPELADELFPLLSNNSRRERELAEEHHILLRELRVAIGEHHPDSDRLADILAQMRHNREERRTLERDLQEQLDRLLTIEEEARLIVALEDFSQEVRQLVHQARRHPDRRRPGLP